MSDTSMILIILIWVGTVKNLPLKDENQLIYSLMITMTCTSDTIRVLVIIVVIY